MSTLPQEYFEFKTDWESVAVDEPHVNLLIERLRLIEMRLPEKRIDILVAMSSDWTCHETLYDETV
ncbi:hypothetical protein T06_11938 [Trichinella sp. T6]|nr:hypothetical protein T06_11938 [Trichinella sp. T6]